jgi:hypothetical protein
LRDIPRYSLLMSGLWSRTPRASAVIARKRSDEAIRPGPQKPSSGWLSRRSIRPGAFRDDDPPPQHNRLIRRIVAIAATVRPLRFERVTQRLNLPPRSIAERAIARTLPKYRKNSAPATRFANVKDAFPLKIDENLAKKHARFRVSERTPDIST